MNNKIFKVYGDFLFEKELYSIFEADDKKDEPKELSSSQKNYQDFMQFALAKFGAETPADLSTEDKKDFFNWIKDNWSKEKGEPKDAKIKDKIKQAKEEGLIPKDSPMELSPEEKEKQKEKEAEEKKAKFKKLMDED